MKKKLAFVAAASLLLAGAPALVLAENASTGETRDCRGEYDYDETCEETVIYETDNWLLAYEERSDEQGREHSAVRSSDKNNTGHAAHDHHCTAGEKEAQRPAAEAFVAATRAGLEKYWGKPEVALADGYRPYPVPATGALHWFNTQLNNDDKVLDPSAIEMFMYAMSDDGYVPIGAAYMDQNRDHPYFHPEIGCWIEWHQHTGHEGAATSFDPNNPDRSAWMAHIRFDVSNPYGENDWDGSEPRGYFSPTSPVPALCNGANGNRRGTCI